MADNNDGNENKKDLWSGLVTTAKSASAFLAAKAKEVDEKHHIVDKTKQACSTVAQKAKEVEEKHHIVEKTKQGITTAATKAKEGVDNISKSIAGGDSKPKDEPSGEAK